MPLRAREKGTERVEGVSLSRADSAPGHDFRPPVRRESVSAVGGPESRGFDATWLPARTRLVLSEVRASIASHAASERQRHLLQAAVARSRLGRTPGRYHAAVHLPLLVHAAVTGVDEPAIPLAAATALLWVGAELHDNLVDGDLPSDLAAVPPAELTYAAMAVSCVLPASIVAALYVPSQVRADMQRQLADGLMRMFAGQERDVALTDAADVDPTAVEASVVGKNGAAQAMYAGLAARLAGAPEGIVRAYADFGLALGVVYQLQSDFHELFFTAHSRDLEHGTRTLQIALALAQADAVERERLVELLQSAKTDPQAADRVRGVLKQPRLLLPWVEKVRQYVERGRAALAEAAPRDPAGEVLRVLLQSRSPACS